jgi:hypothetical protein
LNAAHCEQIKKNLQFNPQHRVIAKKIGKVISSRRKATKTGSIPVKYPLIIEKEQAQIHEAASKNNMESYPTIRIQNSKFYRMTANSIKSANCSTTRPEVIR